MKISVVVVQKYFVLSDKRLIVYIGGGVIHVYPLFALKTNFSTMLN